jgi:hypothetical protein
MHPFVTQLIAQRAATGWPSKRAIHASDQANETAEYHLQQIPQWSACGFDAVKILFTGDSQINTLIGANKINYHPIWIGRQYGNNAPDDTVDPKLVDMYVKQGMKFFESTANEFYASYENKWGNAGHAMPKDWPKQIAHQYARQADAILSAGGVPITPACESWHFLYFMPLFDELCANYASTLKMSCLGMHNRTLNHPPDYDKDTGGYLGWQDMDDYVFKRLGEHMPIIATEAGPEPGWDMDSTYPRVTVDMHSDWVKEILAWPTPDYYLFDCLWEWKGRGAFERASYIDNPLMNNRDPLPVVKMLKEWRPEAAIPVFNDESMRVVAEKHGQEIRIFTGGLLYKTAQERGLGYPTANEWIEMGRIWQRAENPEKQTKSVLSCLDKTYNDLRVVTWPM